MINEPNSNPRQNQTNRDLEKGGTTPKTTEATKGYKEQSQSKQNRNYSQYVMRPLKAVGRGTVKVINWLDATGVSLWGAAAD